jgi:hypothetical protein
LPQSFEAGGWCWITDPKEMFMPGKIVKTFKPGEEGRVKLEDGRVRSCFICFFPLLPRPKPVPDIVVYQKSLFLRSHMRPHT